jgi:hypothetical protein
MNELILGGLIGAISSWLITHVYYKISSRDQFLLFSKLSHDLREIILASPGKTLNSEELKNRLEYLEKGPIDASRLHGSIDGGVF